MLPPEALENTGIDYWLNFIEQAAANAERAGPQQSSSSAPSAPQRPIYMQKPIGIGEKPMKRPTSIRDEMLLQDTGDDEDTVAPNDAHLGQRQPSMSGSSHSSKPDGADGTSSSCTTILHISNYRFSDITAMRQVHGAHLRRRLRVSGTSDRRRSVQASRDISAIVFGRRLSRVERTTSGRWDSSRRRRKLCVRWRSTNCSIITRSRQGRSTRVCLQFADVLHSRAVTCAHPKCFTANQSWHAIETATGKVGGR